MQEFKEAGVGKCDRAPGRFVFLDPCPAQAARTLARATPCFLREIEGRRSKQPHVKKTLTPPRTNQFRASDFRAIGRWGFAVNRKLQTANPKNRAARVVPTRAACVSRWLRLVCGPSGSAEFAECPALARYVRGASAPSGLEGARSVLMILWDKVSERFARLQEFDFSLHPQRQDDLTRRDRAIATHSVEQGIRLKHPQRLAEQVIRKTGKPEKY